MARPTFLLRASIATLLALSALPAHSQTTVSTTVGAQAYSSGTVNITATGKISASGSTVAVVPSGTVTINNAGIIEQTGSGRAIDNTSANAVLTINNTGTIRSVSTDAFRVNVNSAITLTNSGTISVSAGGQALDWAAITSKMNSVENQAGGTISAVGEDAIRPGTNGIVLNAGTISATPTGTTDPTGSDGIQANTTGVQVTNTGTITGRHGITGGVANYSLSVTNNAGTISAVNGSGINIDGVFTTTTVQVTNAAGATIKGGVLATATDGDGDGVDVDGVLTLTNAGDILGLGARGSGSDGLGNNAEAVAMGGGTITNQSTGRIVGSSLAADAPNGDTTRAGNGILVDDSSNGNAIAKTTITNNGLIQGKTGVGIRIIGNFDDVITNNAGGTIRGAGTTATLQTGGGADQVTNRGAIISDTGKAIDLQDGDDTLTVEGGVASIVGDVSGGTGSNTFLLNPGMGQSFAYAQGLSNFDLVHVQSGTVRLTGVNTYTGITKLSGGGRLELEGADRLAANSALVLSNGYLKVNASGPNGQTFASLTLEDNSIIDLSGSTSLSFTTFNGFTMGKTLAIVNYSPLASPDFAIRFDGDLTGSASFLQFIAATTVNGAAAEVVYDGSHTEVVPAPEPTALSFLVLAGGCFFGTKRRRARA